ncbi:DNA-processing protein DprA [Nakamurella sp.]|uniref:DNA-processing protein DprA n=1 Tax=Nakamurella sp. TaxID=1869182 RepID=UPI003B3A3D28
MIEGGSGTPSSPSGPDGPGGDPAVDPERVALAGLVRVCEPPSAAVARFVLAHGPAAAWSAVLARRASRPVIAATAARVDGVDPAGLVARARADLVAAARVGARLIGPQDAEWPAAAVASFAGAMARGVRGSGPPVGLYVRGRPLAHLPDRAVTLVGSRASSPYGTRVAAEIAHELARAGRLVVSGAAFGIDTAAHRSALQVVRSSTAVASISSGASTGASTAAVGGPAGSRAGRSVTVAVLACGIDRAYPEANRELLDLIARFGSVVSEYPPGTVPARHRFLVRNRLIAAFGAGTVVVEAGRRSGTLSTAAAAEQLGRVVMAVPGPVTSAMSVGCHLLLADRFAQLVTGADDVLAALGGASGALRAVGSPGDAGAGDGAVPGEDPRHPTDGLAPETARIYDAFPARGSVAVPDLVVESGLPVAAVLGALAVLQVHGLVDQEGPLWHRIRRPRS